VLEVSDRAHGDAGRAAHGWRCGPPRRERLARAPRSL